MSKVLFTEQITPDAPTATHVRMYVRADGQFYYIGSDGLEHTFGHQKSSVAVGETLNIASGYAMVMASPFTNNGTIVNNGILRLV